MTDHEKLESLVNQLVTRETHKGSYQRVRVGVITKLEALLRETRRRSGITDYIDFCPYDTPMARRRELDVGDIYINQVRHTVCGWYIRSKNRHDYVTCKCGGLSVDGGSWYQALGGDTEHAEDHLLLYKDAIKARH